ncbi:MAG: M42 family peptidase [Ignavibacteriae bacterium]|nr:MAG: M42 family peptidase [Ignavibacteriota bacterium]
MTDEQKQFLIKLLNEPAISGFEGPVQKIWKDEVSKYCDNIHEDAHGNLTAILNKGKDKSIMVVGHSDEIGLIVNYINDDGFIYFKSVGGIDPSMLSSQRVRIINKNGVVHGAIGRTSVHLDTKDEKKAPKMHELWIDIGAENKEEAEKYVAIGDPVVFGEDFQQLIGDSAMARCWDNRVGIYVSAEVVKRLSKEKKLGCTVYGVSSTQEESGLWAARQPGYTYDPTLAIAVDVMPCTDNPGICKEKFGDTKVGKGPVITRGVRTNNQMSIDLIELAKEKKIPYQVDVDQGWTATDADPISMVKGGIPIGVVSLPTRYLHTSIETLSLKDIDDTVELLVQYILNKKF